MVGLGRVVDGTPAPGEALDPAPGQRALARDQDPGEVGDHPAAGEGPLGARIADELGHPAHRLLLEQVGGAGGDGEVHVVRSGQRLGQHPDLEPGRADVGEVERARRRDGLVEDPGRVREHLRRVDGRLGQRLAEAVEQVGVDRGLFRARALERVPGVCDQRAERRQHRLAVGERRVAPPPFGSRLYPHLLTVLTFTRAGREAHAGPGTPSP